MDKNLILATSFGFKLNSNLKSVIPNAAMTLLSCRRSKITGWGSSRICGRGDILSVAISRFPAPRTSQSYLPVLPSSLAKTELIVLNFKNAGWPRWKWITNLKTWFLIRQGENRSYSKSRVMLWGPIAVAFYWYYVSSLATCGDVLLSAKFFAPNQGNTSHHLWKRDKRPPHSPFIPSVPINFVL